jgi:AMMECR1 domain-containing protein
VLGFPCTKGAASHVDAKRRKQGAGVGEVVEVGEEGKVVEEGGKRGWLMPACMRPGSFGA